MVRMRVAMLTIASLVAPAAHAQHEHGHDAGAAIDAAMARHGAHGAHALHLAWTPTRTPTRADSVRAATVADEARRAVARYRDVKVATADGFRQFAPGVKQGVYHYTNRRHAMAEAFRFDPAKPTSLLYRETPTGALELIGVMYAAPARLSAEELDARVPLSIARWHRHVNLCLPPLGARERWGETRDGSPVFGPASPIATKEACTAVSGRFLPQLFGWMVHANVFASKPSEVWQEEHGAP